MTKAEYRKYTGQFLYKKKGIAIRSIRNNKGDIIKEGEVVTISGKSGRGGLNICSDKSNVYISQVDYESIRLMLISKPAGDRINNASKTNEHE